MIQPSFELIVGAIAVVILMKILGDVFNYTDNEEQENTQDKILTDNLDNHFSGDHTAIDVLAMERESRTEQAPTANIKKPQSYPTLTEVLMATNEVDRHKAREVDTSVPSFYTQEQNSPGAGGVKEISKQEPIPVANASRDDPPSEFFGVMDFNLDNARDIVAFDNSN